ncbi:Transporter of the ATP-binding cassette (ABC), partial [Coemansia sp. BCRC 34301]
MRDNRTRVGSTVVALSVAQTALLAFAWQYGTGPNVLARTYTLLSVQLVGLVATANAVAFAVYLFSDRMLYAGLFPWPLPTLVLMHLLIGSCEIYYSFFTPATRHVPIFGFKASIHSNALVASTLLSATMLLTYTRAQVRPFFVRPLLSGSADSQYLEYTPANDVEANEDDDEATPLARRADQKPEPLVKTSEFNASWYSTLAFSWTNDILRRGTVRQLEATDLYYLDESDMPVPSWRRYLRHRKPGRSLLVTMLITFAPELLLQAVLALTTSVLYFSGPFFLQRILRSIELLGGNGDSIGRNLPAEKSIRGAYLDAFGLLFFTLAATTLSNQTLWVGRHIGIRLKGLLVAELSAKTLRRRGKGSWEDAKPATEEEEKDEDDMDAAPTAQAAADGKIMNLLTADFSKVAEVSAYLDNIYSMPLMLFIGIWYMYLLLGVSALVGLSMTVFYIPLSKMLFKYLTKVEEKLTSLSDERVTVITELLQGIKAVKLFGWESRFLEMVDERRERQLKYMWKLLVAWVRVHVASSLAPMLVLVIIFIAYIIGFGNKLTAEIAFTTISVFQLIRIVFEHLPGFLNWVIGGYVALGRIDSYLGQPQVQDLEK